MVLQCYYLEILTFLQIYDYFSFNIKVTGIMHENRLSDSTLTKRY